MNGMGSGPGAPGMTRNVAAGGYPSQRGEGKTGAPGQAMPTQAPMQNTPSQQNAGQPQNPMMQKLGPMLAQMLMAHGLGKNT